VTIPVKSDQQLLITDTKRFEGQKYFSEKTSEEIAAQDTQNYDASLNFTGSTGTSSKATYSTQNSDGYCYHRTLTSASNNLTESKEDQSCHEGHDHGQDHGENRW
jgi:hypothetical protein